MDIHQVAGWYSSLLSASPEATEQEITRAFFKKFPDVRKNFKKSGDWHVRFVEQLDAACGSINPHDRSITLFPPPGFSCATSNEDRSAPATTPKRQRVWTPISGEATTDPMSPTLFSSVVGVSAPKGAVASPSPPPSPAPPTQSTPSELYPRPSDTVKAPQPQKSLEGVIQLRLAGHSFGEIATILNMPKSTVYRWCQKCVREKRGIAPLNNVRDKSEEQKTLDQRKKCVREKKGVTPLNNVRYKSEEQKKLDRQISELYRTHKKNWAEIARITGKTRGYVRDRWRDFLDPRVQRFRPLSPDDRRQLFAEICKYKDLLNRHKFSEISENIRASDLFGKGNGPSDNMTKNYAHSKIFIKYRSLPPEERAEMNLAEGINTFWTAEKIEALQKLRKEGMKVASIARSLGITAQRVRNQIKRLDQTPPRADLTDKKTVREAQAPPERGSPPTPLVFNPPFAPPPPGPPPKAVEPHQSPIFSHEAPDHPLASLGDGFDLYDGTEPFPFDSPIAPPHAGTTLEKHSSHQLFDDKEK